MTVLWITFNKAKEVSYLSDKKRIHIGCVAVYKNQILSIGYNTNKTHPIQKKYNIYREMEYDGFEPSSGLHAEMMCLLGLKDLDIDYSKVKLYIYREDQNGNLANCKPCPACMELIDRMGIKKIYYTTEDGYEMEVREEEKENHLELNFRYSTLYEINQI